MEPELIIEKRDLAPSAICFQLTSEIAIISVKFAIMTFLKLL